MSKAPVFIVCSPHAKTGTSTVTRLICDYLKVEERGFALFDTDLHSRALADWFPETCTIADLTTTKGQIALFDRLVVPGEDARIVEVSSQAYARFLAQARDIGLIEEARTQGLDPVILFVTNGTRIAVEAARALGAAWRDVPVITVLNEGRIKLGNQMHDHLGAFESPHSFQIPALDASARDVIEQPGFSLSEFFVSPPPEDMSLVVRADLRSWLNRAFMQFRSHEVRKAFDDARYLMRA